MTDRNTYARPLSEMRYARSGRDVRLQQKWMIVDPHGPVLEYEEWCDVPTVVVTEPESVG